MKNLSPKNPLWRFIDENGSFCAEAPDGTDRLYFPLANEAGILSSITPDLHGDIKTSHDSFLTTPVTIEDLRDSKSSRNFWVRVEGKGIGGQAWSLTGVSAAQNAAKFSGKNPEKASLEAGILWHKVTRENGALGLKAEILNFVPVSDDTVEIMMVSLQNTGAAKIQVTPTSAIPIFGRSATNIRDHYHVTTLLHRILSHPAGVVVKPTMSFDERGHRLNETAYAVLGVAENGDLPEGVFSTMADFVGEGGNLEAPRAVIENLPPPQKDTTSYQGKPAIGAIRFKTVTLGPRQRAQFVLILGIAEKESQIEEWLKKFGSHSKAQAALEENKNHWAKKLDAIRFKTQDPAHDGWLRWVGLQPFLRKLFGCSFLPDFDYGRGGRGWRDLWQDSLALLLTAPAEAKKLLLHNFNGVRIDGSNATIVGSDSASFVADRNRIPRVWMDHGVWPYLTLELYIHQSGDWPVLFENARYFRDHLFSRARKKDADWTEADGQNLKTKKGRVVQGTVLEHLLVQHLVPFFNVGEHNHIRLENADWNDGLDMAAARGESVAFTSLYGSNLKKLAGVLEHLAGKSRIKKVALAAELGILLDRVKGKKVNYHSPAAKQKRLGQYFTKAEPFVSGKKIAVPIQKLIQDLREKADFIMGHVAQREWIQTRFGDGLFNGYYDNHGRRVEGDFPHGFRMTLAGQVFPIMSGVASLRQVSEIFKTAKKYLKDKEHGGFRLNTDFHEIRLDLGRAFSFAYGEKENGAFFSHMAVLLANALYRRGFVKEGEEVLTSIYRMCLRTEKSKIYPGIPEYFNSEGRGHYHYLTGSASWLVLTMLTQVFGVRGLYGDLVLAPKLTREIFGNGREVSVNCVFADKKITVTYRNPKKIPHEHTCVTRILMNGKNLEGVELNKKEALIPRELFLKSAKKTENHLVVSLE